MNIVILHGTNANHSSNWFPWLQSELESQGHIVWVPDLPGAERPDAKRYTEYLLGNGFDFQDCIIIGHSSGAVAVLALLAALPLDIRVRAAILVGSFTERLAEDPSWGMLADLFSEPFNYEKIKQQAGEFVFIHSEDDPYCPIEQAEFLHKQLGGEFIRYKDKGHFSYELDVQFSKFPELLDIITRKTKA